MKPIYLIILIAALALKLQVNTKNRYAYHTQDKIQTNGKELGMMSSINKTFIFLPKEDKNIRSGLHHNSFYI